MRQKQIGLLSQRYMTALRKHLKRGSRANLHSARGLGRQAVGLGLETLDLAKIHERALAAMGTAAGQDGIIPRAKAFFAEVITPIENTHRDALKTTARLARLNKVLGRRTANLKTANRLLKQGVARRKAVEDTLKKRGKSNTKLLKKSRRIQGHLRHLTHRILSAQEDKRRKISRDLHNEIGQTLLGVNIRLLALKREATIRAEGFKKEIANTQRLVEKSVKTLNWFAREFDLDHES